MAIVTGSPSDFGLENHGLKNLKNTYWSLNSDELVDKSVANGESKLSNFGSLVAITGKHTGRAPNDKFTVKAGESGEKIWWGDVNKSITPEQFKTLHQLMITHYEGKDAYIMDVTAAAHPDYQLKVRVVTEEAWHSLFARNMFLHLPDGAHKQHIPEFTILQAPSCYADPEALGINSSAFIVINFEKKLVLIGGTSYAGEIKKSIFTVLNYLLPQSGVMTMHCSANVGKADDVALFFGLSGTGKTTLSSDPDRRLIGDDEHGWGDDGVFNFEGGCYAKVIRLSEEFEPVIYEAAHQSGTILENVVMHPDTGEIDFDDNQYTENTRVSYPINFVDNAVLEGRGNHAKNVFFLTADAFGVLPPISKLSVAEAMYYFLSGYTSKLGGTEKGLGKEPQATFSACFGAPFLPLHPKLFADLLGEKIRQHDTNVWLINTGWTGGPYGVGKRMHLPHTRAMVTAAMTGALDSVTYRTDENFGLSVPESCPEVPDEVLNPRQTWADKAAYDVAAKDLVQRFSANFANYSQEFNFSSDDISANLLAS